MNYLYLMKKLVKTLNNYLRQGLGIKMIKPDFEPAPNSAVMLVPDDRIDRRVLLEARSLVKVGWSVTVIAAPPPYENYTIDEDSFPDVNIVRIDGDIAVTIQSEMKVKLGDDADKDWKNFYWYHNHFYFEAIKCPAQVYVAHDLPVLPAALMASKFYGSHLVYDAHELYPEQHHFGKERTKLYTEVEGLLAPRADYVITVNQSIANEMVKRYKIELPEVILNCPEVDTSGYPIPRTGTLQYKLGIPNGFYTLLFQGSLSLNRNLENLVSAMGIVKRSDVALVIMGPGDQKRDELIKIAEKYEIMNKKVFFHPAVSQLELLQYTASADAGIIPYPHIDLNSYLCSPNKLFEFIVAGVPILANDSPELRRFVGDQGIGLNMPMTCPEDIACAIDLFFSNDISIYAEKLKKIGSEFTWEGEGRKIVSIYSKLMEKSIRAEIW